MAYSENKVSLIGNVGQDPEVRYAQNGDAVTNVRVATSEQWNDRATGERKEKTEWHRVVFFGKVAEIAGEYLKKGSKVRVVGKLQTREWEKDGVKRYSTEIVVSGYQGELGLLGDSPGERAPRQESTRPAQQRRPARGAPAPAAAGGEFDDDIPF